MQRSDRGVGNVGSSAGSCPCSSHIEILTASTPGSKKFMLRDNSDPAHRVFDERNDHGARQPKLSYLGPKNRRKLILLHGNHDEYCYQKPEHPRH